MIILVSCNPTGTPKPDRKYLIPEDKLVDILTDTYLAAAMLDMPGLVSTWGQRDSNLNYIDVIESHGYTYQQLDTTMRYYFNAKPKKLSRVYDRVKEFNRIFTERNGTDECSELLGHDLNSPGGKELISRLGLTEKVCEKCIRDSVEIIESLE